MTNSAIDTIAQATGRLPSGLFIVTIPESSGEGTAYLASFVQQVSLNPVLIALAVAPERWAYTLFEKTTHFGLHVLEKGQAPMLKHFGRGFGAGEPAFQNLNVSRAHFGVPLIQEIAVRLVLRKKEIVEVAGADHKLVIGEVVHAEYPVGDVAPESWVHLRKNGRGY